MIKLHRYWIQFDASSNITDSELSLGCGITAYSKEDAMIILKENVADVPNIINIEEDVNINSLDEGHVIRRMGIVSNRGVWFPRKYES